MEINLKALTNRFSDPLTKTLHNAVGLCVSRTHYNVEIEHWLAKMLEMPNSDLRAICKQFDVDTQRLEGDLSNCLAHPSMKTGNSRPPSISPNVIELARNAWLLASLDFGASRVRTGHVITALLNDPTLARSAHEMSQELQKIKAAELRGNLTQICAKTSEAGTDSAPAGAGGRAAAGGGVAPSGAGAAALEQYTVDLTARAKAGEIDPILGRDSEIRQITDILTRRRQNNPILTGEAGVGKTAVAEGFALKVAQGEVPEALKDVAVRVLDLGLLQAGASMKGEFENRLKGVIDGVKASPQPIILFIDEAHTLIGAGGAAGQGDAANLLKPALARGELRTIAATTWAEYKKYFERDAALARRFQVVKVEEPDEAPAIEMMRGLVHTLEKHHKVRILDEAVVESVRLSNRYISGRQLPDKSVSVLDTACARVQLSQSATPAEIEDLRRRIEQLGVNIDILTRELDTGGAHDERIAELSQTRTEAQARLTGLEEQWGKERDLVGRMRGIRRQLEGVPGEESEDGGEAAPVAELTDEERAALRSSLGELDAELAQVQGENPLMHVCVDGQAIGEIVASWTGIPVGRMVSDEINSVLELRDRLQARVVGQDHALEAISQAIRTSRANLTDPNRPIGVFLMVGTSGVGKTETAISLAEELYGGEQNMTVINMTEFKEEHKVSLLMGSPPGYVGYGEGGVLTEAVRRKPYSVVLLDEMEKAHPGVQDVFYQVFDKGRMTDGEGREIDFRNTVVIMTSNAGTDAIMKLCADPDTMPDADGLVAALHPELLKTFKPAFLGRCKVVVYFPLKDEVMGKIVRLKLGKVQKRIAANYRAAFTYGDEVVANILSRCHEVESGARNVDNILNGTLLPELSAQFLSRLSKQEPIGSVRVGIGDEGGFTYEIS